MSITIFFRDSGVLDPKPLFNRAVLLLPPHIMCMRRAYCLTKFLINIFYTKSLSPSPTECRRMPLVPPQVGGGWLGGEHFILFFTLTAKREQEACLPYAAFVPGANRYLYARPGPASNPSFSHGSSR